MFFFKLRKDIKMLRERVSSLEDKMYRLKIYDKRGNKYSVVEILELLLDHQDLEIHPAHTKITLARTSE